MLLNTYLLRYLIAYKNNCVLTQIGFYTEALNDYERTGFSGKQNVSMYTNKIRIEFGHPTPN